MTLKEEYTQRLEARLKEWDDKLTALKQQSEQASSEVREKLDAQREHLIAMREETRTALSELASRGESAWDDIKTRTESSWDKMTTGLEKLVERIRHPEER